MFDSKFLVIMKTAEVSPINKKADSIDKGYNRPMGLLTTVSQLHESAMNDQIVQYFIHIFEDLRCVNRKGYSSQAW